METDVRLSRIVRYQTFELNLRTRELYKNGRKLKLQGQPIDVLAMLIEKPGELVTREDLRKKLWPENTFVDFEHGLNSTITRLRDALGDHGEKPRFIETLPRLGYRLIVPLEDLLEAAQVSSSVATAPEAPTKTPSHVSIKPPGKAVWTVRRRWLLAATILVVVLLASAAWYLRRPLPQLHVSKYTQITHDGRNKELIGTDGVRLYLNRHDEPVAEVAISGGAISPLPIALPGLWLFNLSPDGSTLLFHSNDRGLSWPYDVGGETSLWSVPVPGGPLRRLTNSAAISAAMSPDGTSVVFSTVTGEVDIVRSDGTDAHMLIAGGAWTMALSWSPSGDKIRFSRDLRLWDVSPDGSGLHPVLPEWHPSNIQCCGNWTPDGRFYIFRSDFSASNVLGDRQLWVLDERRGLVRKPFAEPVQLTSGPIRWETPILSKDGKKIFARGVTKRGELVRYDARSNRLQPYLGGISAEHLSFSPDGRYVAYVTFPEGILWKTKRDGSGIQQLTEPPLYAGMPRWSPDGTQILFMAKDLKGYSRGYVIPSGGGAPKSLVPDDKEFELYDPNWSPDGRKIVFCSVDYRWPSHRPSPFYIRVLDLKSRQVTVLPGSDGTISPRWSPDGRFIVALATLTGDLKIFDFQTQRWSFLQKGEMGYPTWSRDGRFIYFMRPAHDPGVFRVVPSGGRAERIVDLNGFRHTGSFVYWMGLDPDDTPMLLRDMGADDIYALTLETQ